MAGIPRPALLLHGVRTVFWLTVLFTFVAAEMPASHAPHLFPWDKAEHFAAFFVLTSLAAAAYPRTPLVLVGLWLSLFGCAIELVQALPIIHRDCDIWDWVADTTAIVAALTPMMLDRWRRFSLGAQP
ncbi:MAG TPA: hypothetical protein VMD53_15355 [Rhizomicrobium sp.]|nr:hypothetical protein [Rhizomicrobium sp.]